MNRHRFPAFAAAIALPWSLAACGDDGGSASSSTSPSTAVDLTVKVGTAEQPALATATLTVSAHGTVTGTGYLAAPDAAAAAATAVAVPAAATRLADGEPPGRACTMIYGSPDTALVTGTLRGKAVNARFHRSDGCGIADWQLLEPLLGRPRWTPDHRRIYFRDETAITVPVGAAFVVELVSNPTTGYQWQPTLGPGARLQLTDQQYLGPDRPLPGAGGYEQFTFMAVAGGTATVTFEYRRSFESPIIPPLDVVTFTVTVTA